MYTTDKFSTSLINSIINFMLENKVKVLPLDFLAKRNDYSSCRIARMFYENHGYRYFTVNEKNELVLHGVWDYLGDEYVGRTFDWIITNKNYGYEPVTIHHCMHIEDLIHLVQIAYDTIGSPYFTGRGNDNEYIDMELFKLMNN